MCTTQKQAHTIKRLPSNKHPPPPSKHPPPRPRPIQLSAPPPLSITFLNGGDTKEESDNVHIIDEDDEIIYIF